MKKANIGVDLNAIDNFLTEVSGDAKELLKMVKVLKSMRKKKPNKDMIEKQILQFDKIIEFWEFLEEDVDVNGERIKNISKEYKKLGKKYKVSDDIQKHMKMHERWTFNW